MDDKIECDHDKVMPKYNDSDFDGLSEDEIQKKYPRFEGTCPDCGWFGVMYSSYRHYIAGDW